MWSRSSFTHSDLKFIHYFSTTETLNEASPSIDNFRPFRAQSWKQSSSKLYLLYSIFFIGSKPLYKVGDDPYLTDGNRRNRSKIKQFPEVRPAATAWDTKLCFHVSDQPEIWCEDEFCGLLSNRGAKSSHCLCLSIGTCLISIHFKERVSIIRWFLQRGN